MKLKILLVAICLLLSTTAFAELSEISAYRINQGIAHCTETDNELTYKSYWKDSAEPGNLSALCMVEQFADQVAADGDEWLKTNSIRVMERCHARFSNDQRRFSLCLNEELDKIAKGLSSSCAELEAEEIWDKAECESLISYVFRKKFEPIREANMALIADSTEVSSELSLTNTFRIKQAMNRCAQSKNEIMYEDYWGGPVKPQNRENICIVEKYADLLASEGDEWLNNEAANAIKRCEKRGRKSRKIYLSCLELRLAGNLRRLSLPCNEIGEKKLWSAAECKSLVSYIFMTKLKRSKNLVSLFSED